MKGVGRNNALGYSTIRNFVTDFLLHGVQLTDYQLPGLKSKIMAAFTEKSPTAIRQSYRLVGNIITGEWKQLCHRDFPSVVQDNDGHNMLAIRANEDSVLLYDQSNAKTMIVPTEVFLSSWSGSAITFGVEFTD